MKKIATIPTFLGIILLTFGVVLGVFGVRQGQEWFLKASPTEAPKEIRITNLTDKSFTVSWLTDSEVGGFVKYGEGEGLENVAIDLRGNDNFETHYVDVEGLKSESEYRFKIGSGGKLFDNAGVPFTIKTAKVAKPNILESDLVSGEVYQNQVAAYGAIVYMEKEGLSPLSALVKSGGSFTVSLNDARTSDLANVYGENDKSGTFKLSVENSSGGKASAVVGMELRELIPVIDIPGNYNFSSEGNDVVTEIPNPTEVGTINNENVSKINFESLPVATTEEVSLAYPGPLEKISVVNPEFSGTAPPGKVVTITVESEPQTSKVLTDSNGEWSWSPPDNLEAGEHTVTISYVNSAGVLQKIVRRFTVSTLLAADNGLGFTASGSAELSPTPTIRPSSTPTPFGTLTPSPSPTPTVRISLTPTLTPTPVVTQNEIPVAGNVEYTLLLIGAGWLLMGMGVWFLRKA